MADDNRAALIAHVTIQDVEIERLRNPRERISASKLIKLHVSVAQKNVERTPLGDASIRAAQEATRTDIDTAQTWGAEALNVLATPPRGNR